MGTAPAVGATAVISDPLVGRTVSGYRIDALVGRGGMSRVYRAEQIALQRRVALKVLSADVSSNAEYRERFLRECRLAASIEHPNILPIYDAGETEGLLYIAMRLVDGTDLRTTLLRDGALPGPRALSILKQTAMAIDAAHAVGLIHRDVKPANLLLAGEHVYLSDFGIAKLGEGASQLTRVGVFVGTIDYASPEQIRNEPMDGRTDLYSLGCVFYECLTGHAPFDHPTDHAILQSQLSDSAPSVRNQRPELPGSIDAVLQTAMAKEREARYRTGALFAEAARLALEGRGGSRATVIEHLPIADTSPLTPSQTLGASESARPAEAMPSATRGAKRSRRPFAVAGLVLLFIMVGAALATSQLESTHPDLGPVSGSSTTPSPTSAPPTAPPTLPPLPPFAGRPILLKPQDVIMPPGEFPFRGYVINMDEGVGSSWEREFSSSNLDYYYLMVRVSVFGPTTSGAAQLSRATCDITFSNPPQPTVSEVTAEVIAEGAKACQYHFEGTTADWVQYITATRNAIVSVAGEARLRSTSNTAAMSQMVMLARQQIAIIDRVSPR